MRLRGALMHKQRRDNWFVPHLTKKMAQDDLDLMCEECEHEIDEKGFAAAEKEAATAENKTPAK